MAEAPHQPAAPERADLQPQGGPDAGHPAPPPLDAIRMQGPRAKGLNKPAVIAAAGGAVAIVLVLASGAVSTKKPASPADAKPIMSDPARPEMAKGVVQDLPASYSEAGAFLASTQPAGPPQLGPPMPGDIAAFAPRQVSQQPDDPAAASISQDPASPEQVEMQAAERSGLFFALREDRGSAASPPPGGASTSPLTALSPVPPATSPDGDRILFPGAVIPASLITSVNSEAPGPVLAQVTQSIHDSATGRTLVIPQGARLIGDYKTGAKYGQKSLAIVWSRIIMPDGTEIALNEASLGPSGAAGVEGKVDNHWGEVFGAAALGTLIAIGAASTEDPALTYGGVGAISRDPVDSAIAEGIQRSAAQVSNRVVDRALAVPPTIRIAAGARISVIVTRRLAFGVTPGPHFMDLTGPPGMPR